MIKKTPLIVLIAGSLTALAIIISGCSTKDPWSTNPSSPLLVTFISAPTDSVPANLHTSFSWAITGGSGAVMSQYRIDDNAWSELADLTTATIAGLTPGSYTFSVQVQDAANHTASASKPLLIKEAAPTEPDVTPPTVQILSSPAEESFVATGSVVAFTWDGIDSLGSGTDLLFQYSFGGVTSEWLPIRTITFSGVTAMDPAVFTVTSKDAAGNVSTAASVSFVIRNATVLYVDDYQWLNSFGNVDPAKEREQKAFYREALKGYAFAEWDIAAQGMPDSTYITRFTTVLFGSDSNVGDASTTWWYDVGDVGGGVLRYYMENGGHLMAIGANILQWLYNTNPPAAGDFEFDWFGIDSTLGWDFWSDFTWAINAGNIAGLPDSMKIDVGKNGNQVDFAEDIFAFRDSVVVLYVKGLDIDGAEPNDYGKSVGHIFYPNGGSARSAMIDFDGFSMPLPGMTETIHTVLNQFGEGPGL